MVEKIEQDKLVVTQSNRLVHASYTMTLDEKRIVMLLLSVIRVDDVDFQLYRFPITDIRDYLDLSTKDLYADIRKITGLLKSRVLEIPEDGGGWLQVGWISSARYVPKGKYGADCACLDLKFDPDLKPYLLGLKAQFTSYALRYAVMLSGFNHIRVYELLNSHKKQKTATFPIDELKKTLKLEGKYDNYKDFRKYVLLTSQRELADKTDLAFDFEDDAMRGRKVTHITFHIRDNTPTLPPLRIEKTTARAVVNDENQPPLFKPTEAETESIRLFQEAINEGVQNGVSESRMKDLLATRNPAHVIENIEIARRRHINSKDAGSMNLAGLTVSAITEDYAKAEREKRESAKKKTAVRERGKRAVDLLDRIETDATIARRKEMNARISALSDPERESYKTAFAVELEAGKHGEHMAGVFRSRGWEGTGIEASFRIYIAPLIGIGTDEEYQRQIATERGYDLDTLKADAKR